MENNQNNQNVSEQEKSVQEQNNGSNVAKNKNTKIQKIIGYSVLSYLIAIGGGLVLAEPIGGLYSWMFNINCNGGGGFFSLPDDSGCLFDGYLISYFFLLMFSLSFFLNKNKIVFLSWIAGIFFIPLGIFIMPSEFSEYIRNFSAFHFGFVGGYLFLLPVILMYIIESLKYFLLIMAMNIGGYFLGKLTSKFKNKHDKIKI